jgi:ribosomal protein S18 acetylase RimI-like enzyme
MAVTIRPIAPDDIPAIAALARTTWLSAYANILPHGQIDYMLAQRYSSERLKTDIEDARKWLHQAFVDDVRAGFAACEVHDGHDGELKLDKLYIHPDMQRRGVGGALIHHTASLARQHGFSTLILAVNKNNEQALHAYTKYGFRTREKTVTDIGGGFVMDDYIMEKKIA